MNETSSLANKLLKLMPYWIITTCLIFQGPLSHLTESVSQVKKSEYISKNITLGVQKPDLYL